MSIEYVTEKEQQLATALKEMREVRDALKNQLEEANSGWYDKLLEATLERDALKDTLQDVRGHYERVCKERDTYQREADKLAMENKMLRDALESLVEIIDKAGLSNLSNGVQLGQTSWYVKASDRLDTARTALGANHEH
jgi:FtsZ-binding cell division protein ZapB